LSTIYVKFVLFYVLALSCVLFKYNIKELQVLKFVFVNI